MQIVINIPDGQIEKSLAESKYIHENEGEKGFVQIAMLFTNAQLEFVDIERKTDFYSCEYKILPKGHGRLKDVDHYIKMNWEHPDYSLMDDEPTIIEADKAESEE